MNKPNSLWKTCEAVLITHDSSFEVIVRSLLKQIRWRLHEATTEVTRAYEKMMIGDVDVVLIDDDINRPAIYQYRKLLAHPFGALIPCIVLDSDTVSQDSTVARSLAPHLARIQKPLSYNSFSPKFQLMAKAWETKSFALLRKSLPRLYFLELPQQIGMLTKLLELPPTHTRVLFSLVHLLSSNMDLEKAEKLLLSKLRTDSKNILTLTALARLYNSHSASHLALRLLEGARKNWGDSIFFLPDLIQAKILLNDFQGAETVIRLLVARRILESEVGSMLTKILIADGKTELATYTLKHNRALLDKILAEWEQSKQRESA